jgi:bifunctional non-homologous end joining protein LigD
VLHEVKHDGFRAQLHLADNAVTIYGKNGGDLTRRFRLIAAAIASLPFESVILDAELVACDPDGTPNFYAMMRGAKDGCCAYCFDLAALRQSIGEASSKGRVKASPPAARRQAGGRGKR